MSRQLKKNDSIICPETPEEFAEIARITAVMKHNINDLFSIYPNACGIMPVVISSNGQRIACILIISAVEREPTVYKDCPVHFMEGRITPH